MPFDNCQARACAAARGPRFSASTWLTSKMVRNQTPAASCSVRESSRRLPTPRSRYTHRPHTSTAGSTNGNMKKTRYTFVTPNRYQACSFDFDPRNPGCLDTVDYHPQTSPLAYYGRVFHSLHSAIENLGLHIIVGTWTVHELPFYGPHVVSVVLQDEWSRNLRYLDRIGIAFRTCGRHRPDPRIYPQVHCRAASRRRR